MLCWQVEKDERSETEPDSESEEEREILGGGSGDQRAVNGASNTETGSNKLLVYYGLLKALNCERIWVLDSVVLQSREPPTCHTMQGPNKISS